MSTRVRAIAFWKEKDLGLTPEQVKEGGAKIIEQIKSIPILQQNLLKYDISRKAEKLPTTLAHDLGLKDTEYTTVIIAEAETHEKLREALTHPDFLAITKGALSQATNKDDLHFFSAEYVTIIDKK
ncbi:hypothetical protein DFH06DRAFT_1289620 [Mycena polygramma]|nr:hypothetical protein DFH06DRAFT_1289620 [Mycena polygramma]